MTSTVTVTNAHVGDVDITRHVGEPMHWRAMRGHQPRAVIYDEIHIWMARQNGKTIDDEAFSVDAWLERRAAGRAPRPVRLVDDRPVVRGNVIDGDLVTWGN
jgi:hypothetical protein